MKVSNRGPNSSMELHVSPTLTFCLFVLPSGVWIHGKFMVRDGPSSWHVDVHVPARKKEGKGRAHTPFHDMSHDFNTQFPLKSCWLEFGHVTRPFARKVVKCSLLSRRVFTSRLLWAFLRPPDSHVPRPWQQPHACRCLEMPLPET